MLTSKRILGTWGVVRLAPDHEVGRALAVTEGIENALTVSQVIGWGPVWAAGTQDCIRKFPVLDWIEALHIFAEAPIFTRPLIRSPCRSTSPAIRDDYVLQSGCVAVAGRRPRLGRDRWCVTWKLYRKDGQFLPHDQCPVAVAIKEQRIVRGINAVARRPDGSEFSFQPYLTPVAISPAPSAG